MTWKTLALAPSLVFAWSASAQEAPPPPENRAPVVGTVTVEPATVPTTAPLTCKAQATDPDGDALTLKYAWSVGGGDAIPGETLPAGATRKGVEAVCTVTASDGKLESPAKTAKARIVNTPPTLAGATLSPENPARGTALLCAPGAASDDDADAVSFVFGWYLDGKKSTLTGEKLPGDAFRKGQEIACEITPKDPEAAGKPVKSNAVKAVDTAPVLEGATLGPEAATVSTALVCKPGKATDADADPVAFAYAWAIGGAPVAGQTAATLPAGIAKKGQAVTCEVTPQAGGASGAPVKSAAVTIQNTAPTLASAALTPEKPTVSDALTCAPGESKDVDGDAVSPAFTWSVNGQVVAGQTGATLPAGLAKKAQSVACEVTPKDGAAEGKPVRSAPRVIANSPPAGSSAAIQPAAPRTTDALTCAPGAGADPDGDPVSFGFAWTVDGKPAVGTTGTFPATSTRKGQKIACVVTPKDGAASGPPITSGEVTIANTPPAGGVAKVEPAEARVNTALSCKISGVTDADADKLTYAYAWTAGGAAISGATEATLPAGAARKGQAVACQVVASDGEASAPPVAAEAITIKNTLPEAKAPAVGPEKPTTTDAITCTPGEATDLDGDAVKSKIAWYANGKLLDGQTGASLPATATAKGQSILCAVTPNDGEADGKEVRSAAVIVQNTAPVLASAKIDNSAPRTTDTLKCEPGEATDADNDTVSFSYAWTVDGKAAGVAQSLPSSAFKKGQEVLCTVTPRDAAGASGAPVATAAVKVLNSPPTLASAKAGPATPRTTDALTCAPGGGADADGDALAYSYAWTLDDKPVGGDSATLEASLTRKGQKAVCVVTPKDGEVAGKEARSEPVLVLNTPPTVAGGAIEPAQPLTTDSLSCKAGESADADTDKVSFDYKWTVSGRPAGEGPTLAADAHKKGDTITCQVTPKDDQEAGKAVVTAAVRIGNTAPAVASAALEPVEARTDTTLTCKPAEGTDIDADRVFFAYAWTVDGQAVPGSLPTLTGASFKRDQKVACIVTPKDGTADGAAVTSSVVSIRNTAPVLTDVAIGPDRAVTTDTLTCKPGRTSDLDGDTVSFRYEWSADGARVGGNTDTLAPELFKKNQSVQCKAWPTDGTDEGEPITSKALVILNSPPVIESVTLSPEAVYTEGTVTAKVVASDPDGDPIQLSYAWTVNGKLLPDQTADSLDGKTHFNRDDRVIAKVTPHDGTVGGAAKDSAAHVIKNTAPTAVMVFLPDPEGGFVDLRCVVAAPATDIDNDPISYKFRFLRDGQPYTGAVSRTVHAGDTVPVGNVRRDETWTCEATPTDGTDDGTTTNFAITVIQAEIGGGSSHSCHLSTLGQLSCWGLDDYKVATPPEGETFKRLAVGGWHNCALSAESGKIKCWGHRTYAQDKAPTGDWKELTSGWWHSCALSKTGEVACWGQSADNRTAVPGGSYKAVDAGGQHTCAIKSDGALACWGLNNFGQSTPPGGSYTAVSSGENHSCALRTDGAVACWGSDESGQLQAAAGPFIDVQVGARHSCAQRPDRSVTCWGLDNYEQAKAPAGAMRTLGKGLTHSCAIDAKGSGVCWGRDNYGQTEVPAHLIRKPEQGAAGGGK